jgi:hypothetical protein
MVKICIDQSGRVNQVNVLQGIPGGDSTIVDTIRSWKFKPQPIPICSVNRFVFTFN